MYSSRVRGAHHLIPFWVSCFCKRISAALTSQQSNRLPAAAAAMFARLERGKRFCHDAAAAEPESTIVFFFSNGRRKQVDDFSQLVCLFCWGKKKKKSWFLFIQIDSVERENQPIRTAGWARFLTDEQVRPRSRVFFLFLGGRPFFLIEECLVARVVSLSFH